MQKKHLTSTEEYAKRHVQIVPPETLADLTVSKPKEKAAGIPALMSAMKHLSEELGIWRGIKILNRMNQKKGFDCPGCAWPDPDGKRCKSDCINSCAGYY